MIPPHYVARNETTRLPRCFVYLDTESFQRTTAGGERQTFQLAAAAHDCYRADRDHHHPTEWETFDDAGALWTWITARVIRRHRTVLVAHNLAYDLRISGALQHLPAMGWRLHAARLDGGQAWVIWRTEGRTLAMVDSVSWLPKPLDHLAKLVGLVKPPLPSKRAGAAKWLERCQADVAILRECWVRVVDWLERDDLGSFKLTGAGQSWAAYRHRFHYPGLLVHNDPAARAAERAAAWSGRCEAWRHGDLGTGPWHEWDLEAAYARIAAECDVPTRLLSHVGPLTPVERARWHRRCALLHRVTVDTDLPLVPTRTDAGIVWPVGTFDTWLWSNELEHAVANGAHVRTHEAFIYRRRPALREWATWVLGQLALPPDELDPVIRLVLKHWSRALIGRFGTRHSTWEPWGTSPDFDVVLGLVGEESGSVVHQLLQLGHDLYRSTTPTEGPDACPQVMSWVMAEARCRLWRVMAAAGLDHVVYVDTDGVIVDGEGHRALRSAGIEGLRVKHRWPSLVVFGPRQIMAGGKLRAAGVPSSAHRTGPTTFEAEVWRQLATSLRRREHDAVVITDRRIRLHGTDHRRLAGEGTATEPVRLPA